MKSVYKFRIYPNREQKAILDNTLETCSHLYNNALAERRDSWENEEKSISYYDQAKTLTSEKKDNPHLQSVYSQVLQDVLRRLDKSSKAFFRRVKSDDKPGYPRFKGKGVEPVEQLGCQGYEAGSSTPSGVWEDVTEAAFWRYLNGDGRQRDYAFEG